MNVKALPPTLRAWLISTGLLVAVACSDQDVALTSALTPTAPRPSLTPAPVIPLVDRAGLVIHGDGPDLTLAPLQDLGVRLVRFSVDWGHARGDGGASDVYAMTRLRDANIEVLAGIAYRYSYEAPPTGGDYAACNGQPNYACVPTGNAFWQSFLPEWTEYVGRTIRQNPRVRYWAVWNEPNFREFFTAGQTEYNAMATALCDTVRAIRNDPASARPDLWCVGPDAGLHNDASIRQGELNWVVAANAAADFDVISVHIYNWNTEMKAIASEVKSLIAKPLWVTETGTPDPTYRPPAADPEFQERDLAAKVMDVRLGSVVDAIFYFDLQTNYAGLLNNYGTPRPAYHALKRILSGAPGSDSYSAPTWGMCSGPWGPAPCNYAANAVFLPSGEHWDCVMTAYVRTRAPGWFATYRPAVGAEILGYRGAGQFGKKQTDANGNASFTANCNVQEGLYFVNGVNGWYVAAGYPHYYDGIEWSTSTTHARTFTVTR